MSTIIYLIKVLQENGMQFFVQPIDVFDFHFKAPPIFSKIDLDQVIKKEVTMIEFKTTIKKRYMEQREVIAEDSTDVFLKDIFSIIGISLCEDALRPCRKAIINDLMATQNLLYYKIFDLLCRELELAVLGSEFSLEYFMSFLSHQLMNNSYLMNSTRRCSKSHQILMESLSNQILVAKAKLTKK